MDRHPEQQTYNTEYDPSSFMLGLDSDFFTQHGIQQSPATSALSPAFKGLYGMNLDMPSLSLPSAVEDTDNSSFHGMDMNTMVSEDLMNQIRHSMRPEEDVHPLSFDPSPLAAGLRILNATQTSSRIPTTALRGNTSSSVAEEEEESSNSSVPSTFAKAKIPEKERKIRHNQHETRRRNKLRNQFDELRALLDVKGDKSTVLDSVIEFVKTTKQRANDLARQSSIINSKSLVSENTKDGSNKNSDAILDFCAIFDTTPVAMAVARMDGKFIDCNKKFIEMTGFNKEQVISTTLFATMDEQQLPKFFAAISKLMSGEISVFTKESQCKRKCGKIFCARVLISVVRNELGVPLFFSVVGIPLSYLTDRDVVSVSSAPQ